MIDFSLPRDGGCRCGRVRLRIAAPPILTMACHCKGCQRMTGSAFSLSAAIPAGGFAVTEGEPTVGGLHGPSRHYHCGYCMSWIFTRPEAIDAFVTLRPTMLDDASGLAPFIETMTREKLPWATTPARHSFEGWPPADAYEGLARAFAAQAGGADLRAGG
jgi:hypothetical protein